MPSYQLFRGAVVRDAAAGTGSTEYSPWKPGAAGGRSSIVVAPLISTATPAASTIELELQGNHEEGDAGAVTIHKWVTQGGRNLVSNHLPLRLDAYAGPSFYDFVRLKVTVTGASAAYTLSAHLEHTLSRPMTGALFTKQLATAVSVGTGATEVVPPFYVGHLSSYKLLLLNRASGQNLTACKIHAYAEESHTTGSTYEHTFEDTSTFGTVNTDAGAELKRWTENDCFIEINEATVASSTTLVDVFIRGTWR